jgi:hypothetical protein
LKRRKLLASILALAIALSGCNSAAESTPIKLADVRPILATGGEVNDPIWFGQNELAYSDGQGTVWRQSLDEDDRPIRLGQPGAGINQTHYIRLSSDPQGRTLAALDVGPRPAKSVVWDESGRELSNHDIQRSGEYGELELDGESRRLAVLGSNLQIFDLQTMRLISQAKSPGDMYYQDAKFDQDRIIVWEDIGVFDVWDVARPEARMLERQDCRCLARWPTVMDVFTGRALFATMPGQLVIWDYKGGKEIADRTVTSTFDQVAQPLAVVGDIVLFSLTKNNSDPAQTAPWERWLLGWDIKKDMVATLWECPNCRVDKISHRSADDNRILLEATTDKSETRYWIASINGGH